MFRRRNSPGCLVIGLAVAAVLLGCVNKEPMALQTAAPSAPDQLPTVQVTTIRLTAQPTPTPWILEPFFDSSITLQSAPLEVPLELQIPALNVNAPILAVGLNLENEMDAPKGPIEDPIWQTAFWYRGSSIPGNPGTATLAGHVNNPLGDPMIFAHLERLDPGDLIIVHLKNTSTDISFTVDEVKVYSLAETSDPAVLARIFGAGPMAGTLPQPAPDGLAHLTLITCAGKVTNGEYDQHTVVYATRTQ